MAETEPSGGENGHSSETTTSSGALKVGISEYFAEPEIPKLEAIIYAEFDNDKGRVIKYQVPQELFDRHHFQSIASAVIPTEEMRGRMIKINMFDWRIIGFPVGIKDKRYQREVL
jgi:hypothetical protein